RWRFAAPRSLLLLVSVVRRHDAPAVAEGVHQPAGAAVWLVGDRALLDGAGLDRLREGGVGVFELQHERDRAAAQRLRREHLHLRSLVGYEQRRTADGDGGVPDRAVLV